MITKYSKAEIEEAKSYLLGLIRPGDTIYTIIRHVAPSGMYRVIDLYLIRDQPINISRDAAALLGGYDEKYGGCRATGCGMDMCDNVVYNLGRRLFPDSLDRGSALKNRTL